ncbi:MAG: glutamate synthase subunit beta [Campylobacteraceae bacterium]|jgi:glutamate synthase (NADPH/NADH) small chain|nr:glutamate synthase subunit beta [Campylobacteraceae bacterium]
MQNFINIERVEAKKRGYVERVKDYREVYEIKTTADASEQSSRCIQCGDPYCHNKCPLHNYIPFWLKAVAKNDFDLAFKFSNETNPFPEITGRVCPQDRICEGDCTLSDGYGAITIGAIEIAITEEGFKKGLKPKFAQKSIGKSVAIIGSGPASISAATYLLRAGFNVRMYEKDARAGGLLTYGIPEFKIQKDVVQRRVNFLTEAGMQLYVNKEVGKDISFEEIVNENDAVFVGIGAGESNKANVLNENAKGTYLAIDFLKNIQEKHFGETDKYISVKDKNVVVIGGGDTAMDCLRVSIREGAKSVKCLYRRDKYNMPGSKKEFKNALEEGVEFIYNVALKDIVVNNSNQAIGVTLQKTILGEKDESGRQKVEIVKSSDFKMDAEVIIFALGFSASTPSFLLENGIELNKYGNIITNNYKTSKNGVYAGGDCVNGADLVVTAAADGKGAAMQIIREILG